MALLPDNPAAYALNWLKLLFFPRNDHEVLAQTQSIP